jgi:hypothetical protein
MSCLLQDDPRSNSLVISLFPEISRHALVNVATVSLSFYMYVCAISFFLEQN